MRYKYKNSKERKVISTEDVKGSIFVYRNKKDLISSKGIVLTSLEALKENKNNISHWTPNVFRYGSYVDENRKITEGHYEQNLRQINTFFLDFDDSNISESDILSVSYEMGLLPTFILKKQIKNQLPEKAKVKIYDLKLIDETTGKETQTKAERTVKIALTEDLTNKEVKVYYINEKTNKLEEIPSTVENNVVVFQTNHFSKYAVVITNKEKQEKTEQGKNKKKLPKTSTSPKADQTASLGIIGLITLALIKRKRQN